MIEHFALLFAVLLGAAVVPFLSRRFSIPSAVLEIVYGAFLFHAVVHGRPDWFVLLKELGFIYLMFVAGMELDVRELVAGRRLVWYVLIAAVPFAVMPPVMLALGRSFYVGIAVSMLSAGIIIPVLKELDLLHGDLGRDIVGIALTGELLSIMMLTAIDIYHAHGLTVMAAAQGAKLLLLLILAGLFLRVLYVLAWWNPERVERVMESDDPVEEGIRAVISVAFAGAFIAYVSGIEPILGSFMAGLVFSYVFRSKGRFEEKINAVGFGFFIPFFFIGVGADFDVRLLGSPQLVVFSLFLAAMVFGSNLLPLLLGRFMGRTGRQSLAVSVILSSPLSLIVVAAALGRKMDYLTPRTADALVLTAIVSGVLFPFLFRLLIKGGQEKASRQAVAPPP